MELFNPSSWSPSVKIAAAAELGAKVPAGAAIAAENYLGAPLVARLDVRMLAIKDPVDTRGAEGANRAVAAHPPGAAGSQDVERRPRGNWDHPAPCEIRT